MKKTDASINRLSLLTGSKTTDKLKNTHVFICGIGGVGSWCAESLVRSGIGNLTIVDSDIVCITNINRQVQATSSTIGKVKVDELYKRLKDINPNVNITCINGIYSKDTANEFNLNLYDYVIDAIDSLSCKIELIINACNSTATLFSALGAANKMDPTQIQIASIWKSKGCKLGRFVRKRLRKRNLKGDFLCVYSEELLESMAEKTSYGTEELSSSDKQINGSAVHITGTYGFFLTSMVIKNVMEESE